jgi:hypothetical protein
LADTGIAGFANAQAFCAYPTFRESWARSHSRWLASLEASISTGSIERCARKKCLQYFRGETDVNSLDLMLERNKVFAAQQSEKHTLMPWLPQALPNSKAVIIGCADMRVDPANLLGLEPGEAVVMRNIGGRVTPGLLEQLGLLGRIGQVAGAIPGGGGEFHLIILQHTDCGRGRFEEEGVVSVLVTTAGRFAMNKYHAPAAIRMNKAAIPATRRGSAERLSRARGLACAGLPTSSDITRLVGGWILT